MPARCSTAPDPLSTVPAFTSAGSSYGAGDGTQMAGNFSANQGGSQAHDNMQPYLTACYCIAVEGIYPSRP